jgi:hypothetical protein
MGYNICSGLIEQRIRHSDGGMSFLIEGYSVVDAAGYMSNVNNLTARVKSGDATDGEGWSANIPDLVAENLVSGLAKSTCLNLTAADTFYRTYSSIACPE